jgi:putative pyruvate formate lyase activating enzyme
VQNCNNCPRACDIADSPFCNKSSSIKINIYQLHYGEEPPISGVNGSGTIFFSNCNLRCKFCQNYRISQNGEGSQIDEAKLLDICYELKYAGAHNLNFVTPTPYVDKLVPVLEFLKKEKIGIPVVWNCGGYESLDMIKRLDGLVDIYLHDFKYSDNKLAVKLSSAPFYKEVVSKVILEMRRQNSKDIFDGTGEIIEKGLIIRHLIIPSFVENSKGVLKIIKELVGKNVYISLMSQYIPSYKACDIEEINRVLSEAEYNEVLSYFEELGFGNGFIQGRDSATDEYVPAFKEDKDVL